MRGLNMASTVWQRGCRCQASRSTIAVMGHKTTLRIDPDLWDSVKRSAKAWAEREGLTSERMTSAWVTRALRRAVAEEEKREA